MKELTREEMLEINGGDARDKAREMEPDSRPKTPDFGRSISVRDHSVQTDS